LFNTNFGGWDQEGWQYPSMKVGMELFNFFEQVIMTQFTDLGWSAAFVMNLIHCMSMDDVNGIVDGGNWSDFVNGLTGDMDKFQCVARVPRDMNIMGIKKGMFNVNANAMTFFNQIDFNNFFNIDFNVGFGSAGFDLSLFNADFDFAAFDFSAFNAFLQPYFAVFDIFSSMGLNLGFDTTELSADNILNFSLDNIANAFEQIAMFMLKYEFMDKNFDNIVQFGEAVTEWMNEFIFWFNNLGAWVDSYEARQQYIFGQLDWSFDSDASMALWAGWVANPTNWGQLLYGTRSWMSFQDVMDKMHDDKEEKHMESAMMWMQFFSEQSEDDFNFGAWAMDGMENGFGFASEAAFWGAVNTHYRNSDSLNNFLDNYADGDYNFNAGAVVATASCMYFTDMSAENFGDNANWSFGEKFDECFYMYYHGLNMEWF
jgi:hypothetical protein